MEAVLNYKSKSYLASEFAVLPHPFDRRASPLTIDCFRTQKAPAALLLRNRGLLLAWMPTNEALQGAMGRGRARRRWRVRGGRNPDVGATYRDSNPYSAVISI